MFRQTDIIRVFFWHNLHKSVVCSSKKLLSEAQNSTTYFELNALFHSSILVKHQILHHFFVLKCGIFSETPNYSPNFKWNTKLNTNSFSDPPNFLTETILLWNKILHQNLTEIPNSAPIFSESTNYWVKHQILQHFNEAPHFEWNTKFFTKFIEWNTRFDRNTKFYNNFSSVPPNSVFPVYSRPIESFKCLPYFARYAIFKFSTIRRSSKTIRL